MPTPTLHPKITAAGLALFPQPAIPGFHIDLTHVALGTAKYTPAVNAQGEATQSALQAEIARFPITSGTNPTAKSVQIGLTITDADPNGNAIPNLTGIGEIGFYSGSTLFAIWSQPTDPLFVKSTLFDVPIAYTLDTSILPASSVTITVSASQDGLSAFILQHEAKVDPHTQYKKKTSVILNKDITGSAGAVLTATEADSNILILTGALAANSVVVVPNTAHEWIVYNNTTGYFTLNVKTAAGTGVQVTQGRITPMWCDGINVRSGITESSDAAQLAFFPRTTAPTGWLKANGSAVPVASYPNLTANLYVGDSNNPSAIFGYRCTDPANATNTRSISGAYIVLPDMRGEFLRGLDDGRGVDSGRSLQTAQADAYRLHSHGTIDPGHAHGVNDPTHSHSNISGDAGSGPNLGSGNNGSIGARNGIVAATTGISIYSNTTGISIQNAGGAETRPRNMAALICIRY